MEEKVKKHQVILKICCVIASLALWLYIFNVENPLRERQVVVPVQILNKDAIAKSNLVPLEEDNLSISLTIRGNASDIYSIKPSNFKLVSDLSAYAIKKGENKIPVEVKNSPANVRITNNDTLWVKINLDDLKRKTVPVKITFDGNAKKGFYAFKPTAKETEISGPKEAVDSVKYLSAKCNIKDASNDMNINIPLQPEDSSGTLVKNVTANPSSLKTTIPIKKVKTVDINVKTQIPESNSGNIKELVPAEDKIDIAGNENVISNINSLDTEYIDLSRVYGKDTIEVKLSVPKGVILVNSSDTIKLKVNLDKDTQKELSLNIQTVNASSNYNVTLDTDKVTVVVSAAQNIINNLKAEDVQCSVDLTSIIEGENSLDVNVKLPEGVTKVSQSISQVKVNAKKKIVEGKNVN
jgi:YbbR domain-containing protein